MIRTERQAIIVWFQHMKNIKQLKRYGHLISVSRKMRYAVIYVDQENIEEKVVKIERLPFVSKVDVSYKPFIRTTYESKNKQKTKEYEYEMGI
ncbi:UPF0298 protein [Halolactibacillus alkaliphilus]|uniref:UPF0298 protein HAL01_01410 n=1 Tax=Halolactibacillus alkaliphilus TaxID=442899 RepID=A0A511WXJ8_9BACI|nr:DUF2129 domain-containing protein [Halolactibacillus alkaliphilus]GEN55677.1 UPF0298 protein [Halolactibacillus alkaliphilus]GGN65435.1 UPF0298 protein [Halolactibacillus alkaliphilus]SFO63751.1 Uncharacterized protein YlbG, UPF0298 family [Halolactibacillus alkaliphilus]